MFIEILFTEENLESFNDDDYDVSYIISEGFSYFHGDWYYNDKDSFYASSVLIPPVKIGNEIGGRFVKNILPKQSDMVMFPVWEIELE